MENRRFCGFVGWETMGGQMWLHNIHELTRSQKPSSPPIIHNLVLWGRLVIHDTELWLKRASMPLLCEISFYFWHSSSCTSVCVYLFRVDWFEDKAQAKPACKYLRAGVCGEWIFHTECVTFVTDPVWWPFVFPLWVQVVLTCMFFFSKEVTSLDFTNIALSESYLIFKENIGVITIHFQDVASPSLCLTLNKT